MLGERSSHLPDGSLDEPRAKWHPGRMNDLLRFPSAVRRDPNIEAWFSGFADLFRLMTRTWFERMRDCGADVRELLHDGCPVACVGDAPFGYVNAFKAHANVGFFYGARCGFRGIADRIPTQAGQHSDDRGQPMKAA
jgi:hypothetical protein